MHCRKPPEDSESEEKIQERLNKLRGFEVKPATAASVTVSPTAMPDAVQADQLIQQITDQIALEDSLPDPDNEIEERLAKLKGVDVEQVRRPGKGLDRKPSDLANIELDQSLLHDHSSYTITTSDENLSKEILAVNKEVMLVGKLYDKPCHMLNRLWVEISTA